VEAITGRRGAEVPGARIAIVARLQRTGLTDLVDTLIVDGAFVAVFALQRVRSEHAAPLTAAVRRARIAVVAELLESWLTGLLDALVEGGACVTIIAN